MMYPKGFIRKRAACMVMIWLGVPEAGQSRLEKAVSWRMPHENIFISGSGI